MREIRTSSSMRAWRKRTVGKTRRDGPRESGPPQQAPTSPSGTAPPRRLYLLHALGQAAHPEPLGSGPEERTVDFDGDGLSPGEAATPAASQPHESCASRGGCGTGQSTGGGEARPGRSQAAQARCSRRAPLSRCRSFPLRAALVKQECQWWPVDRGGGRGRGGPATGAGEVGVARGFPAGLAGGVFRDADAGEAGGRAISDVRRRACGLRGSQLL